MTIDVPWITLSAVLLVEAVHIDQFEDHVEFHIDCLAMGAAGECLPIDVYDTSSDTETIEALRVIWSIGSLLVTKDCWVEVYGGSLRLNCPLVEVFAGDEVSLREDFKRSEGGKRFPRGRQPGQCVNGVVGTIQKCVVMPTKNAGPMGIATIGTDAGPMEAVLFPGIFKECKSEILELGTFEFFGKIDQPESGSDLMPTLVVDDLLRV